MNRNLALTNRADGDWTSGLLFVILLSLGAVLAHGLLAEAGIEQSGTVASFLGFVVIHFGFGLLLATLVFLVPLIFVFKVIENKFKGLAVRALRLVCRVAVVQTVEFNTGALERPPRFSSC
jgi:hypothetical protein